MKSKKQNSKEEIFQQLKGSWTVAEIEITYKPIITDHTIISSSSQAYELIKQLWDKEKNKSARAVCSSLLQSI